MTKTEFIKTLAEKVELPQNKTDDVISTMIEIITKTLAKGDEIAFIGFGSFSIKKRAARMGRNPRTGAELKIPAKKVVRFSASSTLKNAVNKK